MKTYNLVFGSKGMKKSFSVTCGLQEGYGDGKKVHSQDEAVEIALTWMKERSADGKPFLTGTFSTGQVVYAWPEGEDKAGGGHEPVAVFSGEVSPLYHADMTDSEASQLLNELAGRLGNALGQTRVYVAYRDEIWILQAEESSTPTGN